MKKYDSYKDSGVKWIGQIPNHWKLMTNKYFTKSQKNKNSARNPESHPQVISTKARKRAELALIAELLKKPPVDRQQLLRTFLERNSRLVKTCKEQTIVFLQNDRMIL